jgi:hypothetical protein
VSDAQARHRETHSSGSCNFVGLRVRSPDSLKTVTSYDKLSEKEKKQVQEGSKVVLTKEELETMEQKLLDPALGPKTKEYLRSLIEAFRVGDALRIEKVLNEKEARTCEVFVQTFSLEFRKIGRRKWLSNPNPGSLCKIVKIYEFTENETHDLWEMTETRVTAGSTDGICKDVSKELNKPTLWSWTHPKEFELSCDFIEFDVFMPH